MRIQIIWKKSEPAEARAAGEVKALDHAHPLTVATVEASRTWRHTFSADKGLHSFHFAVDRPCKITLSTVIDGVEVGPAQEIDATEYTSGLRYRFEVR